ncbi:PucR family transcriptional regulator [Brevibacterium salitolerans]
MSNRDTIMDVIERLAHRIRRSVAVDDEDLNYIGHSSHQFGDEDMIRLRTLVERQTPGPVREYVFSHGLRTWTEPYLLPAMHRFGFENDRLIYPLRAGTELLGLMWIIHDDAFSESDYAACREAEEELVELMLDRAVRRVETDEEIGEALRSLLSEESTCRTAALDTLRARGLFGTGRHAVAVVIGSAPGAQAAATDPDVLSTLRRAWSQSTSARDCQSLTLVGDHVFALLDTVEADGGAARIVTDSLLRRLEALRPDAATGTRIGIGGPVVPEDARVSYDQARAALTFTEAQTDRRIFWDDHPLWGLLHCAVPAQIPSAGLPALLRSTVDAQPAESLATVRSFLDAGGNAAATALEMHLHRTTVYYRLRQFEEATGTDLSSGHDRLMLHLWLVLRDRVR